MRSVVYLGQDGEVVVGEAAERRAAADPDRVFRGFARRTGDEIALVTRWILDRVAQHAGAPARSITLTHPANWDADEIQAVADALSATDLPEIEFCSGYEAAAASYSIRHRMAAGSTIAVYDLGGGTFEAAVVRTTPASRPKPPAPETSTPPPLRRVPDWVETARN